MKCWHFASIVYCVLRYHTILLWKCNKWIDSSSYIEVKFHAGKNLFTSMYICHIYLSLEPNKHRNIYMAFSQEKVYICNKSIASMETGVARVLSWWTSMNKPLALVVADSLTITTWVCCVFVRFDGNVLPLYKLNLSFPRILLKIRSTHLHFGVRKSNMWMLSLSIKLSSTCPYTHKRTHTVCLWNESSTSSSHR